MKTESIIDTKTLKTFLAMTKKVMPKRNKIPVLDCVRLYEREGLELWIEYNNGDKTTIQAKLGSIDRREGTAEMLKRQLNCLVEYKRLLIVTKAMTGKMSRIRIDTDNMNMALLKQNGIIKPCNLSLVDPDQYPTSINFPVYTTPRVDFTPAKGFIDRLKHAVRFVGKDESRPQFNYVYVETLGGRTNITATDGHRLFKSADTCESSWCEFSLKQDIAQALIAAKTVKMFAIDSNAIGIIVTDNIHMSVNRNTGDESRWPKEAIRELVYSKPNADTLKLADVHIHPKNWIPWIELAVKNTDDKTNYRVTIKHGENETVECNGTTIDYAISLFPSFDINGKYLLDGLKSFGNDTCRMIVDPKTHMIKFYTHNALVLVCGLKR